MKSMVWVDTGIAYCIKVARWPQEQKIIIFYAKCSSDYKQEITAFFFPPFPSCLCCDTEILPTTNPYSYLFTAILVASSVTACAHHSLTSCPRKMGTLIIADTPALCRAVGSTWVGRSVPDTGFNVPITSNDVSPGLRLVFGRPQCAFQMALQTASAGEKQVRIMKQGGNRGTVLRNLIMVSDARELKKYYLKHKYCCYDVYYVVVNNPLNKHLKI